MNSISGKFCSNVAQVQGTFWLIKFLMLGIGLWYKKAKRMHPIADNNLKKPIFKILNEANTIKVIKNPLWVYSYFLANN